MATTTRGIYYPTVSDNIAPLESHFASLASSVDARMAKSQSGKSNPFTLATAVGTTTTVGITFPTAFATAPNIVGNVSSTSTNSAYVVTFYNVGATSCTAKITRVYGTTNDGNLYLNWMAKVE